MCLAVMEGEFHVSVCTVFYTTEVRRPLAYQRGAYLDGGKADHLYESSRHCFHKSHHTSGENLHTPLPKVHLGNLVVPTIRTSQRC
jgi:hemolysin-activating ACP:hemolysin acyltransferase